ncbi:DUF1523 family protein [Halorhodospira halochloris]|uniref:DUF1523 family protein n=1 Tax=Halorhodospira halochloris TaxID=1052 RepID=UPI001EE7A5DC|nr:DUF1523 family protein [Halorhodospira halochloris]MCG5548508.1 DUF1523 family protein [Halorhodospira halochloris]
MSEEVFYSLRSAHPAIRFFFGNFARIRNTVIGAALIFFVVIPGCYNHATINTLTTEVTRVENVGGDETAHYRVYTPKGQFVNRDSMWHLHFNSSDLTEKLDRAAKHDLEVEIKYYGIRFPLVSAYPNIVDVEFVEYDSLQEVEDELD